MLLKGQSAQNKMATIVFFMAHSEEKPVEYTLFSPSLGHSHMDPNTISVNKKYGISGQK